MIHLWQQRVAHTILEDLCFRNIRRRVASFLLRYSHNSRQNSVAMPNHQPKIGSDVLRAATVEVDLSEFSRLLKTEVPCMSLVGCFDIMGARLRYPALLAWTFCSSLENMACSSKAYTASQETIQVARCKGGRQERRFSDRVTPLGC